MPRKVCLRLTTVSSLVCGWDSSELRRVLFYAEEGLSQTHYRVWSSLLVGQHLS